MLIPCSPLPLSGPLGAHSDDVTTLRHPPPSPPHPLPPSGPLGALSNDVTTLRTFVATLKTGVHFVRSLLAALPEVSEGGGMGEGGGGRKGGGRGVR